MTGTTEFHYTSASRATITLVHEEVAWRISVVKKAKKEKLSLIEIPQPAPPMHTQLYLPIGDA